MRDLLEHVRLHDLPGGNEPLEYALSISSTYGFAIDAQPHPWNLPTLSPLVWGSDDEFVATCVASLMGGERRILAMREPPGGWSSEGVNLLGRVALEALEKHHLFVRFHMRGTPTELLQPAVLLNLSLLELTRLDVLAVTTTKSGPEGNGHIDSEQIIEECCVAVAKAGLGPVARLVLMLGLPGERAQDVLETIEFAFRVVLTNGIRSVRFDWLDTQGSSSLGNGLQTPLLSESERANIRETIEFVALLHAELEIIRPQ